MNLITAVELSSKAGIAKALTNTQWSSQYLLGFYPVCVCVCVCVRHETHTFRHNATAKLKSSILCVGGGGFVWVLCGPAHLNDGPPNVPKWKPWKQELLVEHDETAWEKCPGSAHEPRSQPREGLHPVLNLGSGKTDLEMFCKLEMMVGCMSKRCPLLLLFFSTLVSFHRCRLWSGTRYERQMVYARSRCCCGRQQQHHQQRILCWGRQWPEPVPFWKQVSFLLSKVSSPRRKKRNPVNLEPV